jgi:cell division protein FtsX
VFLTGTASHSRVAALHQQLASDPHVKTIYFESRQQAYAEFQRLYTCWSSVPRSATPASYRLVLTPDTTLTQRDRLVASLATDHAVDGVSCDRSLVCLAELTSPSPTPST